MRWLLRTLITAMCLAAGSGSARAVEAAHSAEMPAGQLGGDVVPRRYVLDLEIDPTTDRFRGRVTIDVDMRSAQRTLWLHGADLSVHEASIEQNGIRQQAQYRQVDPSGVALLEAPEPWSSGPARLHLEWDAPFNDALEGLYRVTSGGDDYAFTQFEATSARLAFPGFDEPAFKTPFEIHVTARAEHAVITATPEIASVPVRPGFVRRSFAETPPLPTYLIAFAVGPLDVVEWAPIPPNDVRKTPLPLRGVAARGKGARMRYALANTAGLVAALERYFDYPMPYPKIDLIAVPDFSAGAMENVGAITYREGFLLLGEQPTVAERRRFASIHAHELAHQWFGNLVTPRWWDDIWLNESFASWMAAKAAHEVFPDLGFASDVLDSTLAVMVSDSLASARQIREPVRTNHDIADAFDGITYAKGGAVLRMFEAALGVEAFRSGVRTHMRRFEHGVADVHDFLESLAQGSRDPAIVDMFSSFLFQPGVPLLNLTLDCGGETPRVRVRQSRSLPLGSRASGQQTWDLPVCVRFPDPAEAASGAKAATDETCARVGSAEAIIELPTSQCPAWIMPNANGAGYYRFEFDQRGWDGAFAHVNKLDRDEARVLFAALSSAFRAGRVDAGTMIEGFARAAAHPDWQVATAQLGNLISMRDWLAVTPAARAGVEARIRALYGEPLAALGLNPRPDDTVEAARHRVVLARAVGLFGNDPGLRARLAEEGERYLLHAAGESNVEARIDPDLLASAVRIAVEDRGAEIWDRAVELLTISEDPLFRSRVVGALGYARDPALTPRLLQLLGDARLRDNEAAELAYALADNEAQQDAIWNWIQVPAHREQLLARIPAWRRGGLVWLGARACDAERAAALAAWFGPLAEDLEGGPRALAQARESIELCAALAVRHRADVTRIFSQ